MDCKIDIEGDYYSSEKFTTHRLYAKCLDSLSSGLKIINIPKLKRVKHNNAENFFKKIKVLKLLKEDITNEHKVVCDNKELARMVNIWFPVKAYYLYFTIISLIAYVELNECNALGWSHKKILDFIRKKVSGNFFNVEKFNRTLSYDTINKFKPNNRGDNLKEQLDVDKRLKDIFKLILKYRKQAEKRQSKNKDKYKENLKKIKKQEYVLLDIIYEYRIKSNYQDLDYISENNSLNANYEFYNSYYSFILNVYNSLEFYLCKIYKDKYGEELII